MIISFACVCATDDVNATSNGDLIETSSADYSQVDDVAADNKVSASNSVNSKISTNAVSSTSNNKNSEIKSSNDKISNEYESEVLTTNAQVNGTSSCSTSGNTKINSTKSIKTASSNVKTNVILKVNSMSASPYQTVTFKATGNMANGTPLNNVKAVFKINGVTLNNTYFYNGVAALNYTIPNWSSSHNYTIEVKVGQTDATLSQTATNKLTILKESIKLSMDSYTVSPNSTITLKLTAKYKNGTAVEYAKVAFKVNNKTVGNVVLSNGVASLSYKAPSKYKTYQVLAIVGETSTTNLNSITSNLVIQGSSKITLEDYAASKKSTVKITAIVTDLNGDGASGKVAIKINNKTVKTVSLSDGKATVSYDTSYLSRTINNISVVYGGSSNLNASSATSSLILYNKQFSYSEVLKKAYDTKVFIEKYGKLPNYINFSNYKVSQADFLYMLCKVFDTNSSFYAADFAIKSSSKTSKYNVKIYKADYVDLAEVIVDCYNSNGRNPNTFSVSGYNMSFADAFYFYTRAVAYIYSNGVCSNYGTILSVNSTSGASSSSSGSSTTTNVVPSGYSSYVKRTTNCQVNDSAIKKAVASAIAGVSGTYNQAVAIFNYVNDHTDYSGYYNTRYGAVKTLQKGYGNCVDMAHLVIAMMRTANIPARYAHAKCTFRSGLVTGHVWAQVYINGKWYDCDATSSSNTFGNIVNWYKSTTPVKYTELPF